MAYPRSPKALHRDIIRTALSGITHITPLIHRSKFFIKQCRYYEVVNRLGKIGERMPANIRGMYLTREPGYRQVGFLKQGFRVLTVFFNPREACWPKFRFHTNQSSQGDLIGLYDEFPGYPELKVSSLEYAIDFFCDSPKSVSNLFYVLRRYMFFPHAKSTLIRGDKSLGWNEPREYNSVYHVDMGTNHAKIYERGNDDNGLKGRSGWLHQNVNRIRLEFTFGRPFLVRKNITDLHSLIIDPKFRHLCSPRIQFKHFKATSPFPKYYDKYTATDKDGNNGSLMEEVFKAKRERKFENPLQYLTHNKKLNSLKKEISYELRKLDNNWRVNYYDIYMPML